MKLKLKLVVWGTVFFILFVSYKILEPEISGQHLRDFELNELKKFYVKRRISGENAGESLRNLTYVTDIKVSDVVEGLLQQYRLNYNLKLTESPWQVAANWVSSSHVHPSQPPELGAVLKAMAERPIISANVFPKGSQLKLLFHLEGGQKIVFKPKRFERDAVITGNPYSGEDRHNGEIAAFHLGRLLELRRTPLAIGRKVNLETEVKPVGRNELLKTFFSRDNNTCVYGKCRFCKGPESGACGEGPVLEGVMILYLPPKVLLKLNRHPWIRTYRQNKFMSWETDNEYCVKEVLAVDFYNRGRHLLDIIDTCVLDYLTGNADRHHYHTIDGVEDSMMVILDNGKSFGNPNTDERSILAPLYQCCMIREEFWHRIVVLRGGVLGTVMAGMMSQDPIAPVLSELHLVAMDRRLEHVIQIVEECVSKSSTDKVFIKGR